MVTKTLLIAKVLYPGYLLIFLFDNTTSYFVYAKHILQIVNINNTYKINHYISAMVDIEKMILIKYI